VRLRVLRDSGFLKAENVRLRVPQSRKCETPGYFGSGHHFAQEDLPFTCKLHCARVRLSGRQFWFQTSTSWIKFSECPPRRNSSATGEATLRGFEKSRGPFSLIFSLEQNLTMAMTTTATNKNPATSKHVAMSCALHSSTRSSLSLCVFWLEVQQTVLGKKQTQSCCQTVVLPF